MSSQKRLLVVLGLANRNIPVVVGRGQAVYGGLSGAPTQFPSPPVPLVALSTQIQDLVTEQQLVTERKTGSAALRNAKVVVLVTSLEACRTYVQGLCDAFPEQAATLAAAAGMKSRVATPAPKPVLAVTRGVASGEVTLVANRALLLGKAGVPRAYLNWQSSVDGGKTWTAWPATVYARTTIQGLPALTSVSFRVNGVSGSGATEWSQPVSITVL